MLAHGKVRGRVGLRGAGLRARGRTGSLGAQTRTAARVLGETLSCLRTADRRRQDIRAARLLLCRGRLMKKIGLNRREAVGN
jgi:hypothetical protein